MKKVLFAFVSIAVLLCACKKEDKDKEPAFEIPDAIYMGTVVDGKNILWATFNVGASSPEEYGCYYAWGETKQKSMYTSVNYKWAGPSLSEPKKYNDKDGKTVLDPKDDVAHVKLGNGWRMPTEAEWTALLEKCSWQWTDDYNGTGVAGEIVTATSGNRIFLPAAGYNSYNQVYEAGTRADYWSSSFYTETYDRDKAWSCTFSSKEPRTAIGSRSCGNTVRAVREESI